EMLIEGCGKRLLRLAFRQDLPKGVFRRPKRGFALPIGQWLRGELRPMMHDLLFSRDSFLSGHMVPAEARKLVDAHESFRADHSQRLFALIMLELWWRSAR
ncbi:MAG: asparagine synthase-related protein, partial [Phycisphaerales bacterium]|nr:asparagine synthase-related protein [Phycisphaerales bacterium]